MTDTGYNYIIQKITETVVDPPHDLCRRELDAWVDGYGSAQCDILNLLEKLRDSEQRS